MPHTPATFRVFVSSTFSDLVEERNALQQRVFPQLREYCDGRGAQFQAIDLRWGVSEEAGLDQQTMTICLQELRACQRLTPRPNFIVLLGERYGWRPLPSAIPAAEFEALLAYVPSESQGPLRNWYRRDDNAVPPEYCLLPRRPRSAPGQSGAERAAALDAEATAWSQIEPELHGLLSAAAAALFPDEGDLRRAPYEDSATHREIRAGALGAEDAARQAFAYIRACDGLPRGPAGRAYTDLSGEEIDRLALARLAALKTDLQVALPPGHVYLYGADWRDGALHADLDALCERVGRDLRRAIDEELSSRAEITPLDRELRAHLDVERQHAAHFTGRQAVIAAIQDYVTGSSGTPLVLHGRAGSGKTALIAHVAGRIRAANAAAPHPQGTPAIFAPNSPTSAVPPPGAPRRGLMAGLRRALSSAPPLPNPAQAIPAQPPVVAPVIVCRFIGATPDSCDARQLLRSLCEEISRAYGDAGPVHDDYASLVRDFPQRLALASRDKPLVIMLDGLERLYDTCGARHLDWLPHQLPPGVRLVVSVSHDSAEDSPCTAIFQKPVSQVEVPPLTRPEGGAILDAWLRAAGRTLQPDQREALLGAFAVSGLPLHLQLAFGVARRWKSYTPAGTLSPDLAGLIGSVLSELADDRNHGPVLPRRALGFLTASRAGLAEDELLDLLSADLGVMADFRRRSPRSPAIDRLPVIAWSRLRADLSGLLAERDADGDLVLAVDSPSVRRVVEERWLLGDEGRTIRQALAAYFRRKADPLGDGSWTASALRPAKEIPWQLAALGEWRGLAALFGSLRFVANACSIDRFAVQRYWAQIEAESPIRMIDIYRPGFYESDVCTAQDVDAVAGLLTDAGHAAEAGQLWERLLLLARFSGDRAGFARLLGRKALEARAAGRLEEALELSQKEEGILRDEDEGGGLSACLGNQALILHELGDGARALALHQDEEGICRRLGDRHGLATCLGNQAVLRLEAGELDQALALSQEQERIGRELNEQAELALAYGNQGIILTARGRYDEALSCLRTSERLFREINQPEGTTRALYNQALALLLSGGPRDETVRCFDAAEALVAKHNLAKVAEEAQARLNRLQAAVPGASPAAAASPEGERADRLERARQLSKQGLEVLGAGRFDEALRLFRQEAGLLQGLEADREMSNCVGNQGTTCLAAGRAQDALPPLEEQERLSRRIDFEKGLANSLTNQAAAHGLLGHRDAVLRLAAEAEPLCRQLGLSRNLESLARSRSWVGK